MGRSCSARSCNGVYGLCCLLTGLFDVVGQLHPIIGHHSKMLKLAESMTCSPTMISTCCIAFQFSPTALPFCGGLSQLCSLHQVSNHVYRLDHQHFHLVHRVACYHQHEVISTLSTMSTPLGSFSVEPGKGPNGTPAVILNDLLSLVCLVH